MKSLNEGNDEIWENERRNKWTRDIHCNDVFHLSLAYCMGKRKFVLTEYTRILFTLTHCLLMIHDYVRLDSRLANQHFSDDDFRRKHFRLFHQFLVFQSYMKLVLRYYWTQMGNTNSALRWKRRNERLYSDRRKFYEPNEAYPRKPPLLNGTFQVWSEKINCTRCCY